MLQWTAEHPEKDPYGLLRVLVVYGCVCLSSSKEEVELIFAERCKMWRVTLDELYKKPNSRSTVGLRG